MLAYRLFAILLLALVSKHACADSYGLERLVQKGIPRAALERVYLPLMNGAHEVRAANGLSYQVQNTRFVTIIDYTKPATMRRMFIIDLHNQRIEKFHVAHGINSGELWVEEVSNRFGSKETSKGMYLTGSDPNLHIHIGKPNEKAAIALIGLDQSNSNAVKRGIFLHGGEYQSPNASEGCIVVDTENFGHVQNELLGGSLILAYWNKSELIDNQRRYAAFLSSDFAMKALLTTTPLDPEKQW